MLDAAKRREFDVLLVWRYDRFARSMRELVNALSEFEGLGIDFIVRPYVRRGGERPG
jgi:DNA invertase Pin-like site-specific DNA recombinase